MMSEPRLLVTPPLYSADQASASSPQSVPSVKSRRSSPQQDTYTYSFIMALRRTSASLRCFTSPPHSASPAYMYLQYTVGRQVLHSTSITTLILCQRQRGHFYVHVSQLGLLPSVTPLGTLIYVRNGLPRLSSVLDLSSITHMIHA